MGGSQGRACGAGVKRLAVVTGGQLHVGDPPLCSPMRGAAAEGEPIERGVLANT